MSNEWLSQALKGGQVFQSSPVEEQLIDILINIIYGETREGNERRLALGAAFDLIVSAEYYGSVAHLGWLYCLNPEPLLFYTYTNVCPRCALEGQFKYHKANKPKSGSIGATTSRLLSIFIKRLLKHKGLELQIFRGVEPVDAIFVDYSTSPITVFCAEIKASPLLTLPLATHTQVMTSETNEAEDSLEHRTTDYPSLLASELFLFMPHHHNWHGLLYSIGKKENPGDLNWSYRGLENLLTYTDFFKDYFIFWRNALTSYQLRQPHPTYWFTNGCGHPIPRPKDWPQRAGTGYETISDGKTSVGMDRTDDIKKATYQVLKLGTEGKPNQRYQYKTGVVSNIHAVRHFDEYLKSLKDIIWTRDETGLVTKAGELPEETPLFNIFDGIISLTETVTRDEWVKQFFSF